MRIWDIHPRYLCRVHLLAEHRELHGLWNILTIHNGKGGYSKHPETVRWIGKRLALYKRHELLVEEFRRRGYKHKTPLSKRYATGGRRQLTYITSIVDQKRILETKSCGCHFESSKSRNR